MMFLAPDRRHQRLRASIGCGLGDEPRRWLRAGDDRVAVASETETAATKALSLGQRRTLARRDPRMIEPRSGPPRAIGAVRAGGPDPAPMASARLKCSMCLGSESRPDSGNTDRTPLVVYCWTAATLPTCRRGHRWRRRQAESDVLAHQVADPLGILVDDHPIILRCSTKSRSRFSAPEGGIRPSRRLRSDFP